LHDVEQPEPAYTAYTGHNPVYESPVMRFAYTSLTTPISVFDYDMRNRERTLVKEQPVRGGYDRTDYTSERIWVTAPGGVRIPVSVVYKRGLKKDGSNPTLLYGYGSYEVSIDPTFSSNRLPLLDRGFIFAIAHIRGGGEMGREWYEDGKFLNKINTFTDFIACADQLVEEGYTARDRLAIRGGSAGGLLMGAVLNMRPDLCAAAVAQVPFVDALTTMLDDTLPLTTQEYEEWGNPNDVEYYQYMKSYSPYDNLAATAYPAILVTAGLNDPRVSYWEPAKWVAKLRAIKSDGRPLLLKTQMGAGHGGPSGRYESWREEAFVQSFLISQVGRDEDPS
jgi:oligopeptidase B